MSTRPAASALPQLHDINGVFVRLIDKAYNAHIQESLLDANGGQEVLDFNLPWGNDRIPLIKNEMTINFGGSVFRVRTPQSAFDQQGALSYSVHCEALWYDLQASDPRPVINVTTAIAAMNAAVSGTGWTVGTVGPATNATFQVPVGASALAVLRAIPSVFGGELQFDNVNKVVSLLNSRGQQTGLLYARGKNATQDIVNIDTTNMYTRVYPTGQNGIDISTVNAGASKYIEDYSYYDSISAPHIIRAVSIQNTALTTPAQVLSWGQGQLNAMRFPATTYQFAVTTLKGDVLPNLGDTVKVWDKVLNYQTSARIVGRDIYPLEPTKSTLTINTALASLTSDLATAPAAQVTTTTTADTLAPANPTGVVLNANYSFTGQGTRQITVSASWNAVTTNSDASPITDLDHYEVQYQTDGSGIWIPMGNTTDLSLMSPLIAVQNTIIARVAAVDHAGNRSAWVQTSGTVTADTVAPVQPTPLTLAAGNFPLTIEASWNGQTINNHPMAQDSPDFAFLEVHMSATSGFTPSTTTLIDSIVGSVGGTAVAPGLTPGVTYYFTSIAVDRAGNRSPQSTQVSASTGTLPSNYIGSVSISSLVAGSAALGTLHADITVASRIKTADTGARVEMNTSGIFAYDAGGNPTVQILANGGNATFSGTVNATGGTLAGLTVTGQLLMGAGGVIRTGTTGTSRVEIGSTVGSRYVAFYPGDSTAPGGDVYGYVFSTVAGAAGTRQAYLSILPPNLNNQNSASQSNINLYGTSADGTVPGYIQMGGNHIQVDAEIAMSAGYLIRAGTGGIRLSDAALWLRGGSDTSDSIAWSSSSGDGPDIFGYNAIKFGTNQTNANTYRMIMSMSALAPATDAGFSIGGSTLRYSNGYFMNITNYAGSTSGTTCIFSSGNLLARSSSSRRVKTRIKAHKDVRWDILDLKPMTYHMKADLSMGFKADYMREVGLIAEDVHDAGFPDLIQYEVPHRIVKESSETKHGWPEYELTGEPERPESVKYDRIGVLLLPIIKDLRDRVAALEEART